jgi:hypothetical protein
VICDARDVLADQLTDRRVSNIPTDVGVPLQERILEELA